MIRKPGPEILIAGITLLISLKMGQLRFILPHQAAVTLDIGTEDRRELRFNLICGNGIISLRLHKRREEENCFSRGIV